LTIPLLLLFLEMSGGSPEDSLDIHLIFGPRAAGK